MSPQAPMILAVPDFFAEPADGESPDALDTPGNVDIAAIAADLQGDNVSAPAEHVPALLEVVAHARDQGYDINLVVLTEPQPVFTIFRDIATAVQNELDETEGTVVVLGPNASGTSSLDFSRDTLEKATERVPLQDPPLAAREVVDEILAPGPDWTLITLALIFGVVAAAVVGRITSLRLRARRSEATTQETRSAEQESAVARDARAARLDEDSASAP